MGIVAALCIALILSILFSRKRPFGATALFFFIVFIAVTAASYWIIPFGPVYQGVAWVPLLLIGVVCAFLIMIPAPVTTRNSNNDASVPVAATGIFVWLLFLLLAFAAVSGFYRSRNNVPADGMRSTTISTTDAQPERVSY